MVFFTLESQFYLKNGQKKEENDTFLSIRSRRKTEQCYYQDICSWKRDSFSSEVKITRRIVWLKILKKES